MNSNNIVTPSEYEKSAVLAFELGQEMLTRLPFMMVQPKVIIDAGCGPGTLTALLKQQYPEAQVIGIDSDEMMIEHAKKHSRSIEWIHADCTHLALEDQSVDLIFANLLLPWQADFTPLIREWRRVLRGDGLLMLTAFGPDTMREWHAALADEALVHCIDMHDLGDALLHGFADPVLDVNHYTLTYRSSEQLMNELRESGMLRCKPQDESLIPASSDGAWAVTFEVIYAHAFAKAHPLSNAAAAEVRVPVAALRRAVKR